MNFIVIKEPTVSQGRCTEIQNPKILSRISFSYAKVKVNESIIEEWDQI